MSSFFFFNDTATTEIYTLSLHDALPISKRGRSCARGWQLGAVLLSCQSQAEDSIIWARSEEHTSELQSRLHLVCRLLLEKKKTRYISNHLNYLSLVMKPVQSTDREHTLS